MKEPKRLFESGSPLERSILGFGRDEAPSDDLARKTLSAMAAVRVAHAAPIPSASRWPRPRSILVGTAAIGLGALLVGLITAREAPAPVAPTPASVSAPPAPEARVESPPAVVSAPDEGREVVITPDSLPSAPVRSAPIGAQSPSARVTTSAPVAAPAGSASIAREVELLDSVKAKLGAGQAGEAARALDAYDAEFPAGTLRPEATVLRIRTLLASGDRASAEKLGSAFLAEHPSGVHAKRVRALLGESR